MKTIHINKDSQAHEDSKQDIQAHNSLNIQAHFQAHFQKINALILELSK